MKKAIVLILMLLGISVPAFSQQSNTVNFVGVTPPPAPVITSLAPATGYTGPAYSIVITGTGFSSTCTVSVNGVVTPSTFQSATQLTVNVPSGKIVSGNNPIFTNCPAAVLSLTTPVTLPNATLGQAYPSTSLATYLKPTGGVPPYSYALTSGKLPTGLTLSGNGNVTGLVASSAAVGSTSFAVTVTDSAGTITGRLVGLIENGGAEIADLPLPSGNLLARL